MIIVDYLDFKIKQRHALLARTIGTKAEEESSYTHSHNLVISATASMVALCSLEAAAYFLYNRKVSIYPRIQYCRLQAALLGWSAYSSLNC